MIEKCYLILVLIFIGVSESAVAFDSLDEPDYVAEIPRISLNDPGRRAPAATMESLKEAPNPGDSEINPLEAERFGVQEFSIIVTERGFFPNKVIVRRNIPVNLFLTATDSRSLCFVMKKGEYNFHRGVGAKNVERISFRPTEAGPLNFIARSIISRAA